MSLKYEIGDHKFYKSTDTSYCNIFYYKPKKKLPEKKIQLRNVKTKENTQLSVYRNKINKRLNK